METRNIILLSGKAGSGKDTVADELVEGYDYIKLSYASALKDYVAITYNIDRELMDTQEGKKTIININSESITIRGLLIRVGRDKVKVDPDYWINIIKEKISKLPYGCKIVISDFRFPNESIRLQEDPANNITTIRIERKGLTLIDDPSETSLDDYEFDLVLPNNQSKKVLYKLIGFYTSLGLI